MRRPNQITQVKDCEAELDGALRQLRALGGGANTLARVNIEYRIGALRRRRNTLQESTPWPTRR